MNKKIDEWWNLIVIIICLSIFSAIILNLILSIDIDDIFRIADNSWVGFWGSLIGAIIGGYVTLIGIKITIDENKKREDENKQFNIAPYLALDINKINNEDIIIEKREFSANDDEGKEIEQEYMIINFPKIEYKFFTMDITLDGSSEFITSRTSNRKYICIGGDVEVEKLIYMLDIENLGLGNAAHIYIDNIFFAREDEKGNFIDKITMDKQTKHSIANTCISNCITVGDKFGILFIFKLYELYIDTALYVSIKYSDLLGNEFTQTVRIDMEIYEDYEGYIQDRIDITRIRYPNGRITYMKPKNIHNKK